MVRRTTTSRRSATSPERRDWLGTALFLTGLALAGAFAACDRPPLPRFPHLQHLELACGGPGQPECLTCTSCHANPKQVAQVPLPEASACSRCHKDGQKKLARSIQIAGFVAASRGRILFSHRSHLALPTVRGQCNRCHAGMFDSSGKTPSAPPMGVCLTCHQTQFERAQCTPCHRAQDLRQLMPESFMRHDAGWLRRHGVSAGRQPRICGQCHAETWCAECHDHDRGIPIERRQPDRIERLFTHRGDFITRHALEASSQPDICLRCHSVSSCDSCHISRGVSAARIGSVNPHPLGWLGKDTSSRNFHGRAARRDILSCMTCHDHGPATNCVRCHAPGGPGGRPHPPRWESARSMGDAPCRYCHG